MWAKAALCAAAVAGIGLLLSGGTMRQEVTHSLPSAPPTSPVGVWEPEHASRSMARKEIPRPTQKALRATQRAVKPSQAPRTPPKPQVDTSGWSAGSWGRFPAWVEATARCIAHHESWDAGLWRAENPTSSASGAFQFIDSSWVAYSRSAGLSGWSRASAAPPRVQAAVAAHVITEYGTYPWKGSGC